MKQPKRERIKHGLKNGKPVTPSPPTPLHVVDGDKKQMKIHSAALAQAMVKRPSLDDQIKAFQETFPVAPVPEWVPKHQDVKIAMDNAIAPFYGYAGQFALGGYEYWPGFPALAELTQRSEYRMITETRAKEMTRKWIKLTYKGDSEDKDAKAGADKIEALEGALERFKVRDLFCILAEHDGFFGGGHLFVDIGKTGPSLAQPMVISKATIAKGSLKGLNVIEPMWVYPNTYNSTNPLAADYFSPQTWFVMGTPVHRTRLMTFVSAEMPDILKPAYSFRGLSMSQRAAPYIQNWLRTRQSVSDLLHSFSIVVLKSILQAQIAAGANWNTVYDRIDVFNATRDNRGAMVIDKETEEMDILAVPLGTLDKLQAQAQEQMASVSQIPLVKLLGITPSGLNASSDGEIRVFYDNIHAMQEHLFGDPLRRVIDILQLNEFGEIDDAVGFQFEPLWQLDEAGMALVKKTQADIDAIYVETGAISNEEVRQRLADDETSQYYGLDLDPEEVPEPPETEEKPETSGDPSKQAESRTQARSGV